jgi:hypothetical protein
MLLPSQSVTKFISPLKPSMSKLYLRIQSVPQREQARHHYKHQFAIAVQGNNRGLH